MSWAARNVEKYEECERKAVYELLERAMKANGFEDSDRETVKDVIYVLQTEFRLAFEALVLKAPVGEYEASARGF